MASGTPARQSPLVSIIIPCFVRSEQELTLLDQTLRSVSSQTWDDYETIVVDDGSPEQVDDVVASHARTKLLHRSNGGSAQARNTGIAAAAASTSYFLTPTTSYYRARSKLAYAISRTTRGAGGLLVLMRR